MSVGGMMRTSVSGMSAQASRLGAVSDNIANSNTNGYKQSEVEFSSLVLPSTGGNYNSGAVESHIRTLVSEQGGLIGTGNNKNAEKIDLAVSGNGFFVVDDGNGGNLLTRAGSFTKQNDGTLVNAAGYTLKGYPIGTNGTDAVLNGFTGLQNVNLSTGLLSANPTTKGTLTVPLDKTNVSGTSGIATEAAGLANSGGATTGTALGDYLQFTVTVDNVTTTVNVVSTDSTGINGITPLMISNAINDQTEAAASIDGNGKLVLTSPTTGSSSNVALTVGANLQYASGGAPKTGTAVTTIAGLATLASASGAAAVLPGANLSSALTKNATTSTSLTVYDNSGAPVKLDIYYTKTDNVNNKWEVAVFDSRKASTGTNAPFPYGSTGSSPLARATLDFSESTYQLSSITPATGTVVVGTSLGIDLSSVGGSLIKLDLGNTTQFSGKTPPLEAKVDGNPAEVIDKISVGKDGTVTAVFTSGTKRDLYEIPMAKVNSPNGLTAEAGNAYSVGIESGTVLMGKGSEGGFGDIIHGSLEESTVDLAGELTTMIEAQRNYTANSKVFQTGSEILDVLVNLKR